VCEHNHYRLGSESDWIARAREAVERAVSLQPLLAEAHVARGWVFYARKQYPEAVSEARLALAQKPDCEGGYYMLGRALFSTGRYQDIVDFADTAIAVSGADYNIYVPILNALRAMGNTDALRRMSLRRSEALEAHLAEVPDDVRARIQLAIAYASVDRPDDAVRQANMAMALRPNEATVLYLAACTFCVLKRKPDAIDVLKKAWEAGFKDAGRARRDPDLAVLHGEPEFERLYPEPSTLL
jgi:tetratricopeptide (TPR) repeat protein